MNETLSTKPRTWHRWIFILPVVLFAGTAIIFLVNLGKDPSFLPSTLIGKSVPRFSLPAVKGRTLDKVKGQALGLANTDLVGEVSLVNVFASWCTACRAEHPLFMRLKAADIVPIHGLNYKDNPEDATAWLDELGDPYTRIGSDFNGRAGIEWGVYGVPETFVISKDGRIVYKVVGAITPKILKETLLPMIRRLQKEKPATVPAVPNSREKIS
jgi:cytochrome c biogenesis protein CcmG, thiol:disulfide interchange protein DsbE